MKNLIILIAVTLLTSSCGSNNETEQPLEGVQTTTANRVQVLHKLDCKNGQRGLECIGYTLKCNMDYYYTTMECQVITTKERKL